MRIRVGAFVVVLVSALSTSLALGRDGSPVAGTWLATAVPTSLTRAVASPGDYLVDVSVLAHAAAETVTVYVPGAAPRVIRARPRAGAKLLYRLAFAATAKTLTVHAVSEGPRVSLALTLTRQGASDSSSTLSTNGTAASSGKSTSEAATRSGGVTGPTGSTSLTGSTSPSTTTTPSGFPTSPSGASTSPSEGSTSPSGSSTTTPPQAPDPYTKLLLDDEFVGAAHAAPDSDGADLTEDTSAGTCGVDTLDANTPGSANASLDGQGDLAITALPNGSGSLPYTSAQLESAFSYQYGSVEARIKVPSGQGLCSQFWMVGDPTPGEPSCVWPGCGEIDIVEAPAFVGVGYPDYPPYSIFTVHGPISGPEATQQYETMITNAPAFGDPSAGFHTYGIIWSPGSIVWTIDGVAYASANPATVEASVAETNPGQTPTWEFDKYREHVILDLAVGGWPGAPDPANSSEFPATMLVNWVRWYGCQTGTPQNGCS